MSERNEQTGKADRETIRARPAALSDTDLAPDTGRLNARGAQAN
jgi:hypothetical protein